MEHSSVQPTARIKFSRDMARKVTRQNALTPPVDVEAVATAAGLEVTYALIALPAQYYRDERLIVVKKDEHRHRQRFSIAHELGHWFLHHYLLHDECSEQGEEFSMFKRSIETEAHEFARELLMPLTVLNRLIRDGMRPDEMAGFFDVSPAALWVALSRTGRLTRIKPHS